MRFGVRVRQRKLSNETRDDVNDGFHAPDVDDAHLARVHKRSAQRIDGRVGIFRQVRGFEIVCFNERKR